MPTLASTKPIKRQMKQEAVNEDAQNEKPICITHGECDRLNDALEELKKIVVTINVCRALADEETPLTI